MRSNDLTGVESTGANDAQPVTIAEPGDRIAVDVAGGTLVYEARTVGRELVGFQDVTDYDDLADALAARGHDRGAIYHLPELEDLERGA